MVVHPDFIFYHLQKTGGTTIREFLMRVVSNCRYIKNMFLQEKQPIDVRRNGANVRLETAHTPAYLFGVNSSIFKFGSIRNPWAYYVSWWYSDHVDEASVFDPVNIKKDFKTFMMSMFTSRDLIHDIDFEMVHSLAIGPYTYRYLKTFYTFPMVIIENAVDKIHNDIKYWMILDAVIMMESLEAGLINLFKNFLTPFTDKQKEYLYSMKPAKKTDHKPYQEYYDEELIELVRYQDRIIVDNYGYKYDNY